MQDSLGVCSFRSVLPLPSSLSIKHYNIHSSPDIDLSRGFNDSFRHQVKDGPAIYDIQLISTHGLVQQKRLTNIFDLRNRAPEIKSFGQDNLEDLHLYQ